MSPFVTAVRLRAASASCAVALIGTLAADSVAATVSTESSDRSEVGFRVEAGTQTASPQGGGLLLSGGGVVADKQPIFDVASFPTVMVAKQLLPSGESVAISTLDIEEHPEGTVIINAQTKSDFNRRQLDAVSERYVQATIQSNAGLGVALSALRAERPNRDLHLVSAAEVLNLWGKKSQWVLSGTTFYRPTFWQHVEEVAPDEFEPLVKRAAWELYVKRDDVTEAVEDTFRFLVAPASAVRVRRPTLMPVVERLIARGRADQPPAGELLNKRLDEWLARLGDRRPLSRRRARQIYTAFAKKHGFGELRTRTFSGQRRQVRSYQSDR